MGWERRGNHSYYYRKEREGSKVKSVYVGRGEIAEMVSQFQSKSSIIEKLTRSTNQDGTKTKKAERVFEQATQLLTEASLLIAGFHTHHRQWRRKRSVSSY